MGRAAAALRLEELIKTGGFREDLYYRLNVFPIEMPALRDRIEDLPLLVDELIERMAHEQGVRINLSPAALRGLNHYPWPGNVRELENTLERSVLTSSDYQNIRVIFEGEAGGLGPAMSVVSNELIKLETFEAMQKHYFEAVLKAAKGKISGTDGAAALSGMHPNTLRSKLDKLGVTFKAVKPEL